MRYNAIKHGKLPQIHLDEIEIRGPLFDQWPPLSREILLGQEAKSESHEWDAENVRKLVSSFASRAYRRPATDEEVDRIIQVIEVRKRAGLSAIEAFADGVKVVLCSPNFLYLDETVQDEASNRLTDYAIASRLSYFLWASMPDDELMQLAEQGQAAPARRVVRAGRSHVVGCKVRRVRRRFLGKLARHAWTRGDATGSRGVS